MKVLYKIFILFFVIALLGLIKPVFAIDTCSEGFKLDVENYEIVNCFTPTKVPHSETCSQDLFIPTGTESEWDTFKNNPPSCASVDEPISTCAELDDIESVSELSSNYHLIQDIDCGSYNGYDP